MELNIYLEEKINKRTRAIWLQATYSRVVNANRLILLTTAIHGKFILLNLTGRLFFIFPKAQMLHALALHEYYFFHNIKGNVFFIEFA